MYPRETNPLIVFDPNPMCFGATSAMLHIGQHLESLDMAVLATGSSMQLAAKSGLQVIPCDVRSPQAVERTLSTIDRRYLYVSISNQSNIPFLLHCQQPFVYIDILFWLGRGANPAMRSASAYIIENFPGVMERLDRMTSSILQPHLIGPLVQSRRSTGDAGSSKKSIVVNLGGAESPRLHPGVNTDYPVHMVKLVLQWARSSQLAKERRIHIGTGARAVECIRDQVDLPEHVEVDTYPLDHFNTLISESNVFITAPGLNAPFEGFQAQVPVVFLPPQNPTQVFQLRAYRAHGIHADIPISLEELCELPPLDTALCEDTSTKVVLERLRVLFRTQAAQERMALALRTQLERVADPVQRIDRIAAQDRFMEALGKNGPLEAASIIKDVACALQ